MTAIVTRGDAGNLHLPDETVDLIVTSPPYFGLRSYQDGGEHYAEQIGAEATPAEYLDALMACTAEWMRVLKPGGSIFVNLGDKYNSGSGAGPQFGLQGGDARTRGNGRGSPVIPKSSLKTKTLFGMPWRYAIRCIDELGLILRAEIVWAKPNGLPESVTDRVRRSHEQVFHFVKQPRYYSAVDEVREASADSNTSRKRALDGWDGTDAERDAKVYGGRPNEVRHSGVAGVGTTFMSNPLGKLPGSVWTIPTAPLRVPEWLGIDHFACVDEQTEVLTRRGWLTHDQLRDDDEVAGADLDTGLTRWTRIHGIHRYDYDGDLVAADARGLSMRLTPNHRTLVHRHAGRHRLRQPVEVLRADEVTKQHAIPRAVDWSDDGREKGIGVDMAALCGWVAAEGWVQGKRVRLSQSATANPLHVATIHDLLGRLGGAHQNIRERIGGQGAYTDVTWTLSPALAAEVLRLMPDKLLPMSFGDLPMNEARALLEAFIAGDGHDRPDGRRAIFQKLRQNLDVLQGIGVRCGYNTTLSRDDGNNRWVLHLNPPRPARLRRADGTSLVGREHYKGTVWCVTTGTGTFVARRRGTVFVTGNSYPPELVRRIVLGWSPREVCTACGEGRRPVVYKATLGQNNNVRAHLKVNGGDKDRWVAMKAADPDRIIGYACDCTPTVERPGRGGSNRRVDNPYGQPGREQGAYSNKAGEYVRVGPSRDYLLDGWEPPPATPGVVLDPFAGTGTTMLVASVLGRVGIGVDMSADYVRLAQWRTTDEKQRAKAAGVKPKAPRKAAQVADVIALPGQLDLTSEGEWTA